MMELRTYTLADADALAAYTTEFWPRHIRSLRRYGIAVRGLWTDAGGDGNRVFALVEYPNTDPTAAGDRYRASRDFDDDHADFDESLITSRHAIRLDAVPDTTHAAPRDLGP